MPPPSPEPGQQKATGPAADTSGKTPAAPTPGRQPLTGDPATPGAPVDAAENDPLHPPARYASLDPEIVQLLWRSRETYFQNQRALPFWQMVDTVTAPDLQTLVQIKQGTSAAGFWPSIRQIDSREGVYTYGSSWGIHFLGDSMGGVVTNGSWGRDFPQSAVQNEHGQHGREYTWYRQNTGAGNPGLHMGIGGRNTNVHWDPTNPMDHVGHGLEMGPMGIPVYVPEGTAVYSPAALASHLADIWNIGTPTEHAATPQPFLSIDQIEHCRRVGVQMADAELAVREEELRDPARRAAVCTRVKAVAPLIAALHPRARALAMQDTAGNRSAIDALRADFLAARTQLFEALARLFQHMHQDVYAPPTNLLRYGTVAEWDEKRNMIWDAHVTFQALQRHRSFRQDDIADTRAP